jgi:hypothetical protein
MKQLLNKIYSFLKSRKDTKGNSVYNIQDNKTSTGFNCYDLKSAPSPLDIDAINTLLDNLFESGKMPHLMQAKYQPKEDTFPEMICVYRAKEPTAYDTSKFFTSK